MEKVMKVRYHNCTIVNSGFSSFVSVLSVKDNNEDIFYIVKENMTV